MFERRHSTPVADRGPVGPSPSAGNRAGFTMLELQVSLIVLVAGLFSMAGLLSVRARQMRQTEDWCRDAPTYYVINQSNRWMRKLEGSAALETQAGQESWAPPVSGAHKYDLDLQSWSRDPDNTVMTAGVWLHSAE